MVEVSMSISAPTIKMKKKILVKTTCNWGTEDTDTKKQTKGVSKGTIFEMLEEEELFRQNPNGKRSIKRIFRDILSLKDRQMIRPYDDISDIMGGFEELNEEDLETLKLLYDFDPYINIDFKTPSWTFKGVIVYDEG